jgi:hypothetical protein
VLFDLYFSITDTSKMVKRVGSGAPCPKKKGKTDQERRGKTQTILANS